LVIGLRSPVIGARIDGARHSSGTQIAEERGMAMTIDPVCGMEVDGQNAQWTAEHEGKTYYFCSKGCMLEFKDAPEQYLDPSYEPTEMSMDSES
jgi:Cu+-exporting ATPase